MSFRNTFIGLAALVLAACGTSGENSVAPSGCTSNNDCKGTRVCYHHECVFPEEMDVLQQDAYSGETIDESSVDVTPEETATKNEEKIVIACPISHGPNGNSLYTVNPDGSNLEQVLFKKTDSFIFDYPRLSPNRDLISYSSDETGFFKIHIINIKGQNDALVQEEVGPSLCANSWSSDGLTLIAERCQQGGLYLLNWKEKILTPYLEGTVFLPDWSHDGKRIAYVKNTPTKGIPYFITVEDKTETPLSIPEDVPDCFLPSWSPDDQKIIALCNNHQEVSTWDLSNPTYTVSFRIKDLYLQPDQSIGMVRWSPQEERVAYTLISGPHEGLSTELVVRTLADGSEIKLPLSLKGVCSFDWR